ncbi:minor capsid protein [Capybara microvirus Cap3_SP_344]|nr:minor capsid protein [Capybara microvirus Cap3_SP_344]
MPIDILGGLAAGLGSAAISGLGSLIGGSISQGFSRENLALQNQYAVENQRNKYQREVASMLGAGLNPAGLSASASSAGMPSSSPASVDMSGLGGNLLQALDLVQKKAVIPSTVEKNEADALAARKRAGLDEGRNYREQESFASVLEGLKLDVKQKAFEVEEMNPLRKAEKEKQLQKLDVEIDVLSKNIDLIGSQMDLNKAQMENFYASARKAIAEIQKIPHEIALMKAQSNAANTQANLNTQLAENQHFVRESLVASTGEAYSRLAYNKVEAAAHQFELEIKKELGPKVHAYKNLVFECVDKLCDVGRTAATIAIGGRLMGSGKILSGSAVYGAGSSTTSTVTP